MYSRVEWVRCWRFSLSHRHHSTVNMWNFICFQTEETYHLLEPCPFFLTHTATKSIFNFVTHDTNSGIKDLIFFNFNSKKTIDNWYLTLVLSVWEGKTNGKVLNWGAYHLLRVQPSLSNAYAAKQEWGPELTDRPGFQDKIESQHVWDILWFKKNILFIYF